MRKNICIMALCCALCHTSLYTSVYRVLKNKGRLQANTEAFKRRFPPYSLISLPVPEVLSVKEIEIEMDEIASYVFLVENILGLERNLEKNNDASANLIKEIFKLFINHMRKNLNNISLWTNQNSWEKSKASLSFDIDNISEKDDVVTLQSCCYAQNIGDVSNKRIYSFSDAHGSKSMMDLVKYFQMINIMDKGMKIVDPNVIIIFCGDYLDRGNHTLETLLLAMIGIMQNPGRFIMLKGNHEALSSGMWLANKHGTIASVQEIRDRIKDQVVAENIINMMKAAVAYLPIHVVCNFISTELSYGLFTHAMPELFYWPSETFLNSKSNFLYEYIDPQVLIEKYKHVPPQGIGTEFIETILSILSVNTNKLPAYWTDINEQEYIDQMTGRYQFNCSTLKSINADNWYGKLKFIVRGHQHTEDLQPIFSDFHKNQVNFVLNIDNAKETNAILQNKSKAVKNRISALKENNKILQNKDLLLISLPPGAHGNVFEKGVDQWLGNADRSWVGTMLYMPRGTVEFLPIPILVN